MIIHALNPALVAVIWNKINGYLDNALKSAEFDIRYNIDDLYNDIINGNYVCWIAADKNEIKAAAVTGIVEHPHGNSVYIFLVGGIDINCWCDEMQNAFVDYAKQHNARWIDALVRPGFARFLGGKYGYKKLTEMISCEV